MDETTAHFVDRRPEARLSPPRRHLTLTAAGISRFSPPAQRIRATAERSDLIRRSGSTVTPVILTLMLLDHMNRPFIYFIVFYLPASLL